MIANKSYRVVNIEILTSPCRKCTEAICNRTDCEKLNAFRMRCDQELPSYGVCDFSDDIPSPVKFNFPKDVGCQDGDCTAEAEEAPATATEKPVKQKTKTSKPQAVQKPEPEQKPQTAAPEPLIPVDMTLEQIFPPARMAQLTKTQFTQLSLF